MSVSFRGAGVDTYEKDIQSHDGGLVCAVVSAVHLSLYSNRVISSFIHGTDTHAGYETLVQCSGLSLAVLG